MKKKQYRAMIIFTLVISMFTSFAFVMMDVLFSERIEQNQNQAYYVAMMDHNDIIYDEAELFERFEESFSTDTYDYNGQVLNIYQNNDTGYISYIFGVFDAAGAWGDIIGIMTVDSTFTTIIDVTVLQHEEQLGKDVSQRYFLDQFLNLNMDVESMTPVIIGPMDGSNAYNEVDQLAGATRTSTGFQNILNESYLIYRQLWNRQ